MSVKVQSYSLELKAQAVRMAIEDGLGIKETGKRLSEVGSKKRTQKLVFKKRSP